MSKSLALYSLVQLCNEGLRCIENTVWLMFLQGIFGYMTLRRTLKIWGKTLKNLVKSIKNLEIALNFDQENEWQP